MEENILKDSLNDSLLWRIAVRCSPSNRGPGAILSQPHALANLDDRLLEAMAPKEHDLELSAFDLMLAAQYEEAYSMLLHSDPSNTPALKIQLSKLHFISQPMDSFKTPSQNPGLYELYLAYKTCLFRATLDVFETKQCLQMMLLSFQCLGLKREELEAGTLKKEVMELMDLRSEILRELGMSQLL
ncbi:MAG: hypothetical protein LQ339_008778 [Xanthoria mediterranea]|nr:MAG: hypothetical protein LQ339_008778 [Xanthoria mediterranea]